MDDEQQRVKHDLLVHLFPDICSLESFLERVGGFSRQYLIQSGDSPQYVQLLQRAVVSVPSGAAPVPKDLELSQKENHLSLLHGLVADLVKSEGDAKKTGRNVLTLGLWNAKSADVNGVDGMGSVECVWPNSALNIVRGLSWQKLHERIGTDLLRYVLRETLVFALLPNNCYLQLCGLSMVFVLKQRGKRRQESSLASKLLLKNRAHMKAMLAFGGPVPRPAGVAAPVPSTAAKTNKLPPVVRNAIFYDEKFVKKAGLGQTHVLNHSSCQPTKSFARHLCRVVFQLKASGGRLHKRYRGFLQPLIQLVHNHSRLRFGFFLRIHCPLPSFREVGVGDGDEIELEDILGRDLSYRELISHHTEHFQVECLSHRLCPIAFVYG